jgi:hypothetical protein
MRQATFGSMAADLPQPKLSDNLDVRPSYTVGHVCQQAALCGMQFQGRCGGPVKRMRKRHSTSGLIGWLSVASSWSSMCHVPFGLSMSHKCPGSGVCCNGLIAIIERHCLGLSRVPVCNELDLEGRPHPLVRRCLLPAPPSSSPLPWAKGADKVYIPLTNSAIVLVVYAETDGGLSKIAPLGPRHPFLLTVAVAMHSQDDERSPGWLFGSDCIVFGFSTLRAMQLHIQIRPLQSRITTPLELTRCGGCRTLDQLSPPQQSREGWWRVQIHRLGYLPKPTVWLCCS